MADSHPLETLVRIVVEDAEAEVRREQDRSLNASRQIVLEAQDRVEELTRAARDLGRARGAATERAEARAAQREIEGVEEGAFDALFERFRTRVRLALEALPRDEPRYASALRAWAQAASAALDAPAEVFTARRDRAAVYEALLAAGARDFHVRVEHRVHCGFVARDLEGRTLHDARPDALVARHEAALRALLQGVVPPVPSLDDAAPGRPAPTRQARE